MFKTFPEFSKLTLNDREEYEAYVKEFPPIGSITFPGLMTWWNPLSHLSVSVLNGNLVIPYWLPGDERHSGISLIGTSKVDESICTIFDYLKEKGERARLVNVPGFVVENIQYHDLFKIREDRPYDEYVFPASRFYPLENMKEGRRNRVKKKINEVGEHNITTKSLNLSLDRNKRLLLNASSAWQSKNINNYGKLELEALRAAIEDGHALGIENVCLFLNDELHGFCLYETPPDKEYIIINCIKATHRSSLGFELMAYTFAKWFSQEGVMYGNFNADLGLLRLRVFMLTLGPSNFFRKYTIEPSGRV
jgi:hypothetical protein